jgi:multiple sugar transport system substrate-binding protein
MLCCLLIALLPGCATPALPTATPEPVKIYFAFPAESADYYNDLIEQFNNEHPAVTIERKTARSRDTWEYLFIEQQVDVFAFSTFDSLFTQLYEEERLLNLSPLIRQSDSTSLDDFYPSVLQPFSIDGSVWAIPSTVDLAVVYYNKDLFDQYGVEYPSFEWTWDDLIRTAQQIRDPDQGIYGFVAYPFATIPFVYQHNGRIFDDWQEPTRTTFDDELTVEALEWYASLIHDYDVMPAPKEADALYGNEGNAGYVFWRRKAGIYVDMLSARGGEAWGPGAEWQMEWGMVPLPSDQQASTLGFAQAYAVLADTEYPDLCWEWLAFLSEQMPAYSIPARRSIVESAAYEERVGGVVADVARYSIDHALILSVAHAEFDRALEDYGQAVHEISNGNVTVLDALTDLQRQVEAR